MDDVPTCRICHCTESPGSGLIKLISPCQCSGSLKYVHHSCLQQWLDATNNQRCELCKHPFSMTVKYKPIHKWSSLNASPSERRRLICNSVFNLVSMICIFWSIYVLIERASLDAKGGQIDWSFYVKISVVTIGLIIGVIFLFVQLKLYFSIFMKWRQSNRIVVIRNANLASHKTSPTNVIQNTTPLDSPNVVIASTPMQPADLPVLNDMIALANPKTDLAPKHDQSRSDAIRNHDEGKSMATTASTSADKDGVVSKNDPVTVNNARSINMDTTVEGDSSQNGNQHIAIDLTVY